MDNLIADLHIHSKYSHDSLMSPESIVKKAKKVGLTCIAITDHDTIRGGIEGKNVGEKYSIRVIVGSEVNTDCGDIIGLNLTEEIHVTEWKEVIRAIRSQGGLVVLPHPYREHTSVDLVAQQVDFIECWNARSTPEQNNLAHDLAVRLSKPEIIGSDAHIPEEIGLVKASINPQTFELSAINSAKQTSVWNIRKSQIVSHLKRGEFRKLVKNGVGLLWKKKT